MFHHIWIRSSGSIVYARFVMNRQTKRWTLWNLHLPCGGGGNIISSVWQSGWRVGWTAVWWTVPRETLANDCVFSGWQRMFSLLSSKWYYQLGLVHTPCLNLGQKSGNRGSVYLSGYSLSVKYGMIATGKSNCCIIWRSFSKITHLPVFNYGTTCLEQQFPRYFC